MALTLFEIQAIQEFAEKYVKEFKKAIYKKKVARRRTLLPTRFSAPVNNTGKLAESISYTITKEGQLFFSTEDYLYWLINGRKPSKKKPPIYAIEQWMAEKGITDVSPFAIAQSIANNGSSIYRNYKGSTSNLLNDIPVDEMLEKLYAQLEEGYVQDITFNIQKYISTEGLNLDL